MTTLKTMPSETVGQGRVAWLVEEIEGAEAARDLWRALMDGCPTNCRDYRVNSNNADYFDRQADTARAELRAIIGCDAYRLASALGA